VKSKVTIPFLRFQGLFARDFVHITLHITYCLSGLLAMTFNWVKLVSTEPRQILLLKEEKNREGKSGQ